MHVRVTFGQLAYVYDMDT